MAGLSVSSLVSATLVAAVATGQSAQPSNATLGSAQRGSEIQLALMNSPPLGASIYNIAIAGAGQDDSQLAQIKIEGSLRQVHATVESGVGVNDIAYVSCDSNNSPGFVDPSTLVGNVGDVRPKAILLYSLDYQECNLNGSYSFESIYSMTSATDSSTLLNSLQPNNNLPATIAVNSTNNANGTANDESTGEPPTTNVVAISLLCSIGGIITLLFLIMITSYAVRVHRHPERYGPRADVASRSRETRAKGIARAILETLPIVKFGDQELVKPDERDIELDDRTSSVHHVPEVTGAVAAEVEAQSRNPPKTVNAGPGSESSPQLAPQEVELECSVCTEDFTTGEDVRVLPCHHKYHPACIDPWLLNVVGTCPLCRHDLRPVQSLGAEAAEGDELPPPLAAEEGAENISELTAETEAGSEGSHRHRHRHRHRLRVSRLLDLSCLRTALPEERIAALHQLREQSQQENAAPSYHCN